MPRGRVLTGRPKGSSTADESALVLSRGDDTFALSGRNWNRLFQGGELSLSRTGRLSFSMCFFSVLEGEFPFLQRRGSRFYARSRLPFLKRGCSVCSMEDYYLSLFVFIFIYYYFLTSVFYLFSLLLGRLLLRFLGGCGQ